MAAFRGISNQGRILHICPVRKNFQSEYDLLLWDPGQPLTFEQAGHLLLPVRSNSSIETDYVLLQDVTNIDVETFVETYQQENNLDKCFDVPALVEE